MNITSPVGDLNKRMMNDSLDLFDMYSLKIKSKKSIFEVGNETIKNLWGF